MYSLSKRGLNKLLKRKLEIRVNLLIKHRLSQFLKGILSNEGFEKARAGAKLGTNKYANSEDERLGV